jgi:hypothetical protein
VKMETLAGSFLFRFRCAGLLGRTGTARRLNTSQSTISSSIVGLERAFGVRLLDRTSSPRADSCTALRL